jgi:hypothetical protein
MHWRQGCSALPLSLKPLASEDAGLSPQNMAIDPFNSTLSPLTKILTPSSSFLMSVTIGSRMVFMEYFFIIDTFAIAQRKIQLILLRSLGKKFPNVK